MPSRRPRRVARTAHTSSRSIVCSRTMAAGKMTLRAPPVEEAHAIGERHAPQLLDGAAQLLARHVAARVGGGERDQRAHAARAADRRRVRRPSSARPSRRGKPASAARAERDAAPRRRRPSAGAGARRRPRRCARPSAPPPRPAPPRSSRRPRRCTARARPRRRRRARRGHQARLLGAVDDLERRAPLRRRTRATTRLAVRRRAQRAGRHGAHLGAVEATDIAKVGERRHQPLGHGRRHQAALEDALARLDRRRARCGRPRACRRATARP